MSIVVRFHPTSLTADKYDESIRRLEQTDGGFPPEGLAFHVCFGSGGAICTSARSGIHPSSSMHSASD
jgi:hypothetical protein